MTKLPLTLSRENVRFIPSIHHRAVVFKAGQDQTEPLFIGAPTEKPSWRARIHRVKTICALAMLGLFVTGKALAVPQPNSGLTYQGRLNDGGAPANGNYDLIFNLYDDPAAGNTLGTFSIFSAVPVTNGLFTVQLNAFGEFGTNAFVGQPRWLGIGVRSNTANAAENFVYLTPRQPVTAAPLASYANVAGNVKDGAITGPKLAPGAVSWTNLASVPAGFADGIDNDTQYSAGTGLTLTAPNQFNVNFAGSGNDNTAARSDHGHFGANWNGNSSGYGLVVMNGSTTGTGIYSQQGTGSGQSYPFGNTTAIWGEASQGDAVYGASGGQTGAGITGIATSPTGANYGVYGKTSSPNGAGVTAVGSGTGGTALKIANGGIRVPNAGVGTSTPVFVHKCTTNNITFFLSTTIIDNPYCNNDPNAILMVTPGPTPQSVIHPSPAVAVVYDPGFWFPNRWLLATTDGSHFALGDSYNVMIIKP